MAKAVEGYGVTKMRWMKKLLLGIYLYMAVFFAICLIVWVITKEEPVALVTGISAAVGVESVAAGVIRVYEQKEINKNEREKNYENKFDPKIDQP